MKALARIRKDKAQEWADRINLSAAVAAIIAAGRELIAAQDDLEWGEFLTMYASHKNPVPRPLRFTEGTGQRLMKIARNPVLSNTAHVPYLPAAWGTLYELTKVEEPILVKALADGRIRPDMERADVAALRRRKDDEPAVLVAPPWPQRRYSTVVIDPPWPIKKIPRAGRPVEDMNLRYQTLTLEEIAAIPVPDIARDAAHLYLWTTQKFLPDALGLVADWGFNYQCVLAWVKPNGTPTFGWMYDMELVIFARRGDCPVAMVGAGLWFQAPKPTGRKHSAKPDCFFKRAASVSPEPRISMYERTLRDGFEIWGAEAGRRGANTFGDTPDV